MDPSDIERVVLMRIGRLHAEQDGQAPLTEFRYQVPGSRMNVNAGAFRRGVPAVVAALVVDFVTSAQGIEAVMAAAVNVTQAMRFLDGDQLDVVEFILRVAKHPYLDGVPEAELRRSYTDAVFSIDTVLASLEKAHVLARENDRVRLTR